jgi:hypothetical protein
VLLLMDAGKFLLVQIVWIRDIGFEEVDRLYAKEIVLCFQLLATAIVSLALYLITEEGFPLPP